MTAFRSRIDFFPDCQLGSMVTMALKVEARESLMEGI
jgi:hypothetical protein